MSNRSDIHWMRSVVLTLVAGVSACRSAPPRAEPPEPTLAVLMVVDQLREDLLERYDTLFVGGLRRLLDEGKSFANATHDHSMTTTAPGHTTLSTGVYPSRSGIVGNSWFVRDGDQWRSVYAVEDPSSPILGYPELPGRGPKNIERSGLPDWIAANDPASRVVAISRKDRAAIGLAAQAHGEVYWMADEGGEFITSTAYHDEYPEWVTEFNRSTLPGMYDQTIWQSRVPERARGLTRPDTSRYELDGEHTFFPHRAADLVDGGDPQELNHWRYEFTPFPDAVVLALAEDAIEQLDLGLRGNVDYLGISLSQTDLVGHYFGPLSREQLDNLLRLDEELGRFFTFLDESVGRDRWVLAFSADHGVLGIPEHLAETGVRAKRLTRDDRRTFLDAIASAAPTGEGAEQRSAVRDSLEALPFVEAAYTFEEVESDQPPDSFAVLFSHSHSRTRIVRLESRWGVYARYAPYVLQWGSPPATHGNPYYYDRHVPVIFLGAHVPAGVSTERVATVDVAPTLARLVGVPFPDDLDGRVLPSVVGQ